jgi:glycerol-3-phosphate dehydrogenase
VLIGTTDTDFDGEPEQVRADADDAGYLLDILNQSIPGARLNHRHIASCFAGLRTLQLSRRLEPSSVGREEVIEFSHSGLITVAGGKLTTHREVAGRVVNRVMKMLGRSYEQSPTLNMPLPGARGSSAAGEAMGELPADLQLMLAARYGTRAEVVGEIAAERVELASTLHPARPRLRRR